MEMTDLIADCAILPAIDVASIKQMFREFGLQAHDAYGLDADMVSAKLMEREKLGSTATGDGIAIPHARVPGAKAAVGLFARLKRPVVFDAADGQAVDLVFAILTPEDSLCDHLRALAQASRLLSDRGLRQKLRDTSNAQALYALLTEPTTLPNWARPAQAARAR